MKELEKSKQYSEIIELEQQTYLVNSLYSGTEEAYLVMHQPIEQLLEGQHENLQNTELQAEYE